MATKYWAGRATAVAQSTRVTVGGTLSGETFTISVGGVVVAEHTDSTGSLSDAAGALAAAFNASTEVYVGGLSATHTGSNAFLDITGDVAGVPFVVTPNTPGGSATFAQSETTAATGPQFWDEPENWSDGSVPENGDTVIFRDSSVPVAWGLAQGDVELEAIVVEQSYTGRIGLVSSGFATSADGQSVVANRPEYRPTYLRIGYSSLTIGERRGPGTQAGSRRIKIDNAKTDGTPVVEVLRTATSAAESGLPAVRLLFANSGASLFVRDGAGGVGVAIDVPGETATLGMLAVSGSDVYVSEGVTLTTVELDAGSVRLSAAATINAVRVWGGTLTTEGDFTITTLTVYGGDVRTNHVKTGGQAVAVLNLEGGTVDATDSLEDRTFGTVNLRVGGRLTRNAEHLAVTSLNGPSAGRHTLEATSA